MPINYKEVQKLLYKRYTEHYVHALQNTKHENKIQKNLFSDRKIEYLSGDVKLL